MPVAVEAGIQDASAVRRESIANVKATSRSGTDTQKAPSVRRPDRVEPGLGRVLHALAVAEQPPTRRRPGQAEEIQRAARVEQSEVRPVRVRGGWLNMVCPPQVAQHLVTVRRPADAGRAAGRPNPVLI